MGRLFLCYVASRTFMFCPSLHSLSFPIQLYFSDQFWRICQSFRILGNSALKATSLLIKQVFFFANIWRKFKVISTGINVAINMELSVCAGRFIKSHAINLWQREALLLSRFSVTNIRL